MFNSSELIKRKCVTKYVKCGFLKKIQDIFLTSLVILHTISKQKGFSGLSLVRIPDRLLAKSLKVENLTSSLWKVHMHRLIYLDSVQLKKHKGLGLWLVILSSFKNSLFGSLCWRNVSVIGNITKIYSLDCRRKHVVATIRNYLPNV